MEMIDHGLERAADDLLERMLRDWGAVVEFRAAGGVGYPVRGGHGPSSVPRGLPAIGQRYLDIERSLKNAGPLVQGLAVQLYGGGWTTINGIAAARVRTGRKHDVEVYGRVLRGYWVRWRSVARKELGLIDEAKGRAAKIEESQAAAEIRRRQLDEDTARRMRQTDRAAVIEKARAEGWLG